MKAFKPEIRRARIEIIPMIDTIFFLLVFFMISSLSMVKMKAISVNLPQSSAGAGTSGRPSPAHTVVLTVTKQGAYYINKEQTRPDGLGAALQARVTADPQSVVVLNLSKSETAQTLISVLDTIHHLQTPSGQAVRALISTEPIDLTGHALAAPTGR